MGLLLATINAVGHTVVDDETVAEFLAGKLLMRYPARLTARYGFGVEGLTSARVIEAIANSAAVCWPEAVGRWTGTRPRGFSSPTTAMARWAAPVWKFQGQGKQRSLNQPEGSRLETTPVPEAGLPVLQEWRPATLLSRIFSGTTSQKS